MEQFTGTINLMPLTAISTVAGVPIKHGGTGGVGGGPGGFVTVSVKIKDPPTSYTLYVITQGIAV